MKSFPKELLAIMTLFLGGILGFITSLILEKRKNNIQLNIKFFDKYDSICQDLTNIAKAFINFSFNIRAVDKELIEKAKLMIPDICLGHYYYLPQEVINELYCFYTCLNSDGKYIYFINGQKELKSIDSKDVYTYLEDTILITANNDKLKRILTNYDIEQIPKCLKIDFQARKLMRVLDEFWNDRNRLAWDKNIKKQTIFQTRKYNR